MNKPAFITFTGVDNLTSVDALLELAEDYPTVEFGVLFSATKQGSDPRYIGDSQLRGLLEHAEELKLAAHICGRYSREIMKTSTCEALIELDVLKGFQRAQINIGAEDVDILRAAAFGNDMGLDIIVQTRNLFPDPSSLEIRLVSWLFDPSCGNGVQPESWPTYAGNKLVGYAGGIAPHNVLDVLEQINTQGNYWIDMESGVRTNNTFDVEKCRAVCEAVYGPVRRTRTLSVLEAAKLWSVDRTPVDMAERALMNALARSFPNEIHEAPPFEMVLVDA